MNEAHNVPKYLDVRDFKQPLMLDIGAGGYSSDDKFTSVDLYTECDIYAPMWDIPLPDNSVEAIFSSNALEHVEKSKVVPTLREWHRLLKPEGKLQLIVPDLEWACRWWLGHQQTDWSMDIIFGHQAHEGEFHKTGFTRSILLDYFVEVGGYRLHKLEYLEGDHKEELVSPGVSRHNVTQRCINVEAQKST